MSLNCFKRLAPSQSIYPLYFLQIRSLHIFSRIIKSPELFNNNFDALFRNTSFCIKAQNGKLISDTFVVQHVDQYCLYRSAKLKSNSHRLIKNEEKCYRKVHFGMVVLITGTPTNEFCFFVDPLILCHLFRKGLYPGECDKK